MLGQSKLIADALFVIRRVHVVGDKLLDVSRSLNLSLTGLQRELDDVHGNEVRNLTDACEGRVERTVSQVVFRHHIGAGVSRGEEHFLSDFLALGENGAETDAGEHIRIVALTRHVGLAL
mgnify:CR=1 FL=1